MCLSVTVRNCKTLGQGLALGGQVVGGGQLPQDCHFVLIPAWERVGFAGNRIDHAGAFINIGPEI